MGIVSFFNNTTILEGTYTDMGPSSMRINGVSFSRGIFYENLELLRWVRDPFL